jgi:hypothetical protein
LESGGRIIAFSSVVLDGVNVMRVELVTENAERRDAEKVDLVQLEKELKTSITPPQIIQHELAGIRRMRDLPRERIYVFFLDPRMRYAVRCEEQRYRDGTLLFQRKNEEFEQVKGRELWLPRKSTKDCYTFSSVPATYFKSPIMTQVIEVSEIDLGSIADDQFVLKYTKPGTLITDQTIPGGDVSYQVAATLQALDDDLAAQSKLTQSPRKWGWPLVILVNSIVVVGLGAWAIWKYRRAGAGR